MRTPAWNRREPGKTTAPPLCPHPPATPVGMLTTDYPNFAKGGAEEAVRPPSSGADSAQRRNSASQRRATLPPPSFTCGSPLCSAIRRIRSIPRRFFHHGGTETTKQKDSERFPLELCVLRASVVDCWVAALPAERQ